VNAFSYARGEGGGEWASETSERVRKESERKREDKIKNEVTVRFTRILRDVVVPQERHSLFIDSRTRIANRENRMLESLSEFPLLAWLYTKEELRELSLYNK